MQSDPIVQYCRDSTVLYWLHHVDQYVLGHEPVRAVQHSPDHDWLTVHVSAHHATSQMKMLSWWKRKLGENVCNHVRSFAPNNRNFLSTNKIANKVVPNVNMLGLPSSHSVSSQRNTALIILIQNNRSFEFKPESEDGVLLLTGETRDMTGDYLALLLRQGHVELR